MKKIKRIGKIKNKSLGSSDNSPWYLKVIELFVHAVGIFYALIGIAFIYLTFSLFF
tara:strand:+ start:257 stop:424 length:168 start_codon:yes stop_codon:yes gene_type:complete